LSEGFPPPLSKPSRYATASRLFLLLHNLESNMNTKQMQQAALHTLRSQYERNHALAAALLAALAKQK